MLCFTCRNCGFVDVLPPDNKHQLQAPLKAFQGSNNLVAQILREPRIVLDSNEDALIKIQLHQRAVIEALERHRSLYDAQIQEIQLHRGAVMEALEARRSIHAPIRGLPRDLLIEIFHFVRHSWWQDVDDDRRWNPIIPERQSSLRLDGPLWVLGRNVVLRTPFPKHAREILRTYLERAGEHPLTLHAVSDIERSPKAEEDEIMSHFAQESCHRWKDVIIDTSMHHMRLLEESISHLPTLQTIQIYTDDFSGDEMYRSDVCLKAPQLWQAKLSSDGTSQMKLPPCLTHYSGCNATPDDIQLLGQLPKLRVCHLKPHVAPLSIQVPMVMPHIQCLFAGKVAMLDWVTCPRLESLVLSMHQWEWFFQDRNYHATVSAWIVHFLQRSGCHLKSLSVDDYVLACLQRSYHNPFPHDAFSILSYLKVNLRLGKDGLSPAGELVVQSLTPSSDSPVLLPSIGHLVLCIDSSEPRIFDWQAILNLIRSRRDAGLLKVIEVQFKDSWGSQSVVTEFGMTAGIRALTGDKLEMRVEKWNPPSEEHWSLWGSFL
ncbi:hypothetical protein ARMGADRAFT_1084294 [Armillaria gallica]|uniref:F-box domain-containing protein n=1 Tax=Armillaria gallica TaxID=47427 RepID=A0A2H3D0E2_ARMGA|nr:hypothetical protein ARMGADRAFT_1084294 [Armillaria gallica]